MPRCQKKSPCPCRLCRSTLEPVSAFLISKHIAKYGAQSEASSSPSCTPPTSPVQLYSSELDVVQASHQEDSSEADESSDSSWDEDGILSVSEEEKEAPAERELPASQREMQCELESSCSWDSLERLSDTSAFSGHESSEEETDTEDTTGKSRQPEWTLSYDDSVYSSGIAIQKIMNMDMSLLQWLAMNFHLFTAHPSMSKTAFSKNLEMQASFLSSSGDINSGLPISYKDARRMIDPYVVKKKVYNVCINDCVVYRGLYEDVDICPVCSSVEKKRFIYLPIGPRLARMFGEENLAKLLHSHARSNEAVGEMWDIHDSPTWKNLYGCDGFFGGKNNGISLALELDGVNPFHNIGVQYSMTPIMLTLLNLPRHVRNLFCNIMLVGIVPGSSSRSEAGNLHTYIEIMVDELLHLTQCKIVDQYQKAPVDMKIKVLLYVLDYPGLSKVFNQHGSGSLAGCHWCRIRGIHCTHLDKVIYLSNNSYLAADDPIRDKKDDSVRPKDRFVHSENVYREAYNKAEKKVDKNTVATATGCKGSYALANLPGHSRLEETVPDACHTVKDLVQNILNLITNRHVNMTKIISAEQKKGRLDLRKLTADAQLGEERIHVCKDKTGQSAPKRQKTSVEKSVDDHNTGKRLVLPFLLTAEEISVADERAKNIHVPIGFGFKPSAFISKPGSLKSHDWKQIACHGILKFCLRGTLSKQCRMTLFCLLDSISSICSECQVSDNLTTIESKLNTALALLERDFPLSLQNVTTHIMHHIVQGIRRYGPVYGTWMYVFERFNSWICKRALNMRYPEATAMETFIIYDWCQFMIASGRMPPTFHPTAVEDEDVDDDEDNLKDRLSVRNSISLKKRQVNLLQKEMNCTCTDLSHGIKQYFYHKEPQLNSGRTAVYSCQCRSKSSSITQSSFVCYETNRGKPAENLSSGGFVVFGQILYFLAHTCTCADSGSADSREVSVACISAYSEPCFDEESKLWFCNSNTKKEQCYKKVADLSLPLVTAENDGALWFLDSGKLPYIMS